MDNNSSVPECTSIGICTQPKNKGNENGMPAQKTTTQFNKNACHQFTIGHDNFHQPRTSIINWTQPTIEGNWVQCNMSTDGMSLPTSTTEFNNTEETRRQFSSGIDNIQLPRTSFRYCARTVIETNGVQCNMSTDSVSLQANSTQFNETADARLQLSRGVDNIHLPTTSFRSCARTVIETNGVQCNMSTDSVSLRANSTQFNETADVHHQLFSGVDNIRLPRTSFINCTQPKIDTEGVQCNMSTDSVSLRANSTQFNETADVRQKFSSGVDNIHLPRTSFRNCAQPKIYEKGVQCSMSTDSVSLRANSTQFNETADVRHQLFSRVDNIHLPRTSSRNWAQPAIDANGVQCNMSTDSVSLRANSTQFNESGDARHQLFSGVDNIHLPRTSFRNWDQPAIHANGEQCNMPTDGLSLRANSTQFNETADARHQFSSAVDNIHLPRSSFINCTQPKIDANEVQCNMCNDSVSLRANITQFNETADLRHQISSGVGNIHLPRTSFRNCTQPVIDANEVQREEDNEDSKRGQRFNDDDNQMSSKYKLPSSNKCVEDARKTLERLRQQHHSSSRRSCNNAPACQQFPTGLNNNVVGLGGTTRIPQVVDSCRPAASVPAPLLDESSTAWQEFAARNNDNPQGRTFPTLAINGKEVQGKMAIAGVSLLMVETPQKSVGICATPFVEEKDVQCKVNTETVFAQTIKTLCTDPVDTCQQFPSYDDYDTLGRVVSIGICARPTVVGREVQMPEVPLTFMDKAVQNTDLGILARDDFDDLKCSCKLRAKGVAACTTIL